MIVADTNIVVRFLVADDEGQHARARRLLEQGGVLLPLSVVLEAEWVLRSSYRYPRPQRLAAIRSVVGLPGIVPEGPERLARALDLWEDGLDFADALHLAATPPGATFATFDRALLRRAQALGLPVREP